VNKYQEQISPNALSLIDKLMQLLADALIRIRSLKRDSIERVSKLPNSVHARQ
jgi:hypothetical protein